MVFVFLQYRVKFERLDDKKVSEKLDENKAE